MTQTQAYSRSDWSRASPHASPFIVRCARESRFCAETCLSGESARQRQAGSGVEWSRPVAWCNWASDGAGA